MLKFLHRYTKHVWPRQPVVASQIMTPDEAKQSWHLLAEDVVVDIINTTLNSAERIFLFVSLPPSEPLAEVYVVIRGQLHTVSDIAETIQAELRSRVLPKVQSLFAQASQDFTQAGLPAIAYVEIQTEQATGAWFSRIIWRGDAGADLPRRQVLNKWLEVIKAELPTHAIDSDRPLSWYPNAAMPPAKNAAAIVQPQYDVPHAGSEPEGVFTS